MIDYTLFVEETAPEDNIDNDVVVYGEVEENEPVELDKLFN